MTTSFSQVLAQQTKKYNTSVSVSEQSCPTNNQFAFKPQSTIQFAKTTQRNNYDDFKCRTR